MPEAICPGRWEHAYGCTSAGTSYVVLNRCDCDECVGPMFPALSEGWRRLCGRLRAHRAHDDCPGLAPQPHRSAPILPQLGRAKGDEA